MIKEDAIKLIEVINATGYEVVSLVEKYDGRLPRHHALYGSLPPILIDLTIRHESQKEES